MKMCNSLHPPDAPLFADVGRIFVLSMGNHLESCREDVRKLYNIFNKLKITSYLFIFDCNPKEQLMKYVQDKTFTEKDLLIVHYSGHGKLVGKQINGKMEMLSTWLSYDMKTNICSNDIDIILSYLRCKIFLLSDSCHSGRFGDFYTAFHMLFIGSSSLTDQSKDFNKTGVLVNLLAFILSKTDLQYLTFSSLQNDIKEFYTENKIIIKPVLKYIIKN